MATSLSPNNPLHPSLPHVIAASIGTPKTRSQNREEYDGKGMEEELPYPLQGEIPPC